MSKTLCLTAKLVAPFLGADKAWLLIQQVDADVAKAVFPPEKNCSKFPGFFYGETTVRTEKNKIISIYNWKIVQN